MIGRLRERGVLMRTEQRSNGRGGFIEDVVVKENIWFALYPLSIRHVLEYRAEEYEANARLIIRWRDDITNHHLIEHKGIRYRFLEISYNPSNSAYMDILAAGEKI